MTNRPEEIRAATSLIRTYRRLSWAYRDLGDSKEARRCRESAWWWVAHVKDWREAELEREKAG